MGRHSSIMKLRTIGYTDNLVFCLIFTATLVISAAEPRRTITPLAPGQGTLRMRHGPDQYESSRHSVAVVQAKVR